MASISDLKNKAASLLNKSDVLLGQIEVTDAIVYFDVITVHEININSNITDNYLENGDVINDAIVNQPVIITISGLSAESVYRPSMSGGFLERMYNSVNSKFALNNYVATDKLTYISQLYPPIDNITQAAKNAVTVIEGNVKRYKKIFKNILEKKSDKATRATRLQEVHDELVKIKAECKKSGEGLSIVTPYATYSNMFIQSIALKQDNQNFITDISVTLKQCNFAETSFGEFSAEKYAEMNKYSRSMGDAEDKGPVQGHNQSWLSQMIHGVKDKAQ